MRLCGDVFIIYILFPILDFVNDCKFFVNGVFEWMEGFKGWGFRLGRG